MNTVNRQPSTVNHRPADLEMAQAMLSPFGRTLRINGDFVAPPSGVVVANGWAWATDRVACARLRCDAPESTGDQQRRWYAKMVGLEWWPLFDSHTDWRIVGNSHAVEFSYDKCSVFACGGVHEQCPRCQRTGYEFIGHVTLNNRRIRMPYVLGMVERSRPLLLYAHIDNANPRQQLLFRAEEFDFQAIVLPSPAAEGGGA